MRMIGVRPQILLLLVLLLLAPMHAAASQQQVYLAQSGRPSTTEAFYSGKAFVLAEMAVRNVNELETIFNEGVSGTRVQDSAWKAEVIAVIGIWDAVLAQAQRTEPPNSLSSTHDELIDSLELFVQAGDDFERGIQGDNAAITNGNRQMQQAIDNMTGVIEDIGELVTGESMAGRGSGNGAGAEPQAGEGSGASVSGVGTMVSDSFTLSPGRYKVTATLEVAKFDGFIAHLFGPGGFEEYLFNELIEEPGIWTASTVLTIDQGGEFFVEIDNTDAPWTLDFAPL